MYQFFIDATQWPGMSRQRARIVALDYGCRCKRCGHRFVEFADYAENCITSSPRGAMCRQCWEQEEASNGA